MKYITATTITTALLCVDLASAAKFTEARRARHAERRAAGSAIRSSAPKIPSTGLNAVQQMQIASNGTDRNVEYSSNWAGAVLVGSGYTSVTGTFTVPTPSGEGAASAWVGIDGDTATNSILQAGLDFYSEDGEVSFDAWYEWYPDYAYDFTGISISSGDQVKVTVTADTTSSGTAVIENLTTNQTVTHSFSGESDSLQELNAEWIVEDFEEGNSLVDFADFGTVTFTNAVATTSSGSTVAAGDDNGELTILDIEQDGTVLTSVSVEGDSVTVKYLS
ncbi:acid proteinase [Xylariaceae sp. FL0255]|nr:acid proteinase [Xylariaceae sp. FL0255]